MRHVIRHRYDPEADAVYVAVRRAHAFGEDLGPNRRIDYAADRTPVGIELLSVSRGVDLDDLPYRDEAARILVSLHIPILTGQSRLPTR